MKTKEPSRLSNIRILAFSDWRTQDYDDLLTFSKREPDYDLVIYSGDDLDRLIEAGDTIEEIVSRSKAKRLLFVAGNDDTSSDKALLNNFAFAHDLHEAPFFFQGVAFFGVEGTTDGKGFIQHTEDGVKKKLFDHVETITAKTKGRKMNSVLVSHAPPEGVLDSAMRYSENGFARSIGSKSVRAFLEKNKISLTICGHVHLFGGRQQKLDNGNCVLNIASHDDPGAVGKIALIDLFPSGSVEIHHYNTNTYGISELRRLSEVGHKRAKELRCNGIIDLSDVIPENREKLQIRGVGVRLVHKWILQAKLIHSNFCGFYILNPKSMGFLDDPGHIIWDIETDLSQTRIWLIGAHDTVTDELSQFFNLDDERDCLIQFLEWINSRRVLTPVSYSGTRFDARIVANALKRYGLKDLNNFIGRDIDLCAKLRYNCISTLQSIGLKTAARELGYKFKHPDIDGFTVGEAFSRYLNDKESPANWKDYIEYNEDDVLATLFIFNKLKKTIQNA